MGEALYRKYRPKKLSDVIGQDHITQTLENAVRNNKIRHGYLFSGPRGIGKTSVARILAHLVNNFEYNKFSTQLDIIEIDAASNRRIDEIRELRDKVHITPSHGVYKVYIIDEVHMLTREAFNALLKILEEPPAHAIFILATTEAHKLPPTIVSRTQHFTFKPVQAQNVAKHLKNIARKEKINIDRDALNYVAEYGQGSFRDSISLLDQLSNYQKITSDEVLSVMGRPNPEKIEDLYQKLTVGTIGDITQSLENLYNEGTDPNFIANELMQFLRLRIINGNSVNPAEDIDLIKNLLVVQSSHSPERQLEVCLCQHNLAKNKVQNNHGGPIHTEKDKSVEQSDHIKKTKQQPQNMSKKVTSDTPAKRNNHSEKESSSEKSPALPAHELWEVCLNNIKDEHNTLYGLARMATPQIKDAELHLIVPYAFHKKRLEEKKSKAIILDLVKSNTDKVMDLIITVQKKSPKQEQSSPQIEPSDTYSEVTRIFGGSEIVEA